MSQPGNRWIVKVVLFLAVLAFIGVSMIPLFAAFNDNAPSRSSTTDPAVKLSEEIRGLEVVLQREPENVSVLKNLLERRLELLSLGKGDVKAVIEPLEKLAKLQPEETKYGVLLAQAKQQIGDREGAAQAYRSILSTRPGDLNALQGMVGLLLSQKRPEAAIGLLEETLNKAPQANKIQPNSVSVVAVQVLLGNVYAEQKRYSQAIAEYDKAAKTDPKDFRPLLAKAMLLKEQGKAEEAKPLFSNAAALAPAEIKDEINKQASEPVTPAPASSPSPAGENQQPETAPQTNTGQ